MDGCVEGVASLYFFTVPFCSLLRLGRASVQGGRREMCGLSNPRGCCPPYISLPVSRQSSMENEPVQGGGRFPPKREKAPGLQKRNIEKRYVFKWEDKRHEKQVTRRTQVRRSDLEYAAHLPVSAVTFCLELGKAGSMLRMSALRWRSRSRRAPL